MVETYIMLNLQLFADGAGEGTGADSGAPAAEAASTVVSGSDDGYESKLRALGVPEAKIAKQRAYKSRAAKPQATVQQPQEKQPDAATDSEATPDENSSEPAEPKQADKRMSWDEIMADPEYKQAFDQQTNEIVRKRLKDNGDVQNTMQALKPAIEVLARKYGMSTDNLDFTKLAEKIEGDSDYYMDIAMREGVDVETVMERDKRDREQARQQQAANEAAEQAAINAHISSLIQQGEALKQVFPTFNLDTELKNPAFFRMTSPGVNIPVEDAYRVIHRKEIEAASAQVVAQRTAQNISATIQAGQSRPQEGKATQSTVQNVQKLSHDDIIARMAEARRRGMKYYPDGSMR